MSAEIICGLGKADLTPLQQRIVKLFLENQMTGTPLTIDEWKKELGYKSKASVYYQLFKLSEEGYLCRPERQQARGWHLNPDVVFVYKLSS